MVCVPCSRSAPIIISPCEPTAVKMDSKPPTNLCKQRSTCVVTTLVDAAAAAATRAFYSTAAPPPNHLLFLTPHPPPLRRDGRGRGQRLARKTLAVSQFRLLEVAVWGHWPHRTARSLSWTWKQTQLTLTLVYCRFRSMHRNLTSQTHASHNTLRKTTASAFSFGQNFLTGRR